MDLWIIKILKKSIFFVLVNVNNLAEYKLIAHSVLFMYSFFKLLLLAPLITESNKQTATRQQSRAAALLRHYTVLYVLFTCEGIAFFH